MLECVLDLRGPFLGRGGGFGVAGRTKGQPRKAPELAGVLAVTGMPRTSRRYTCCAGALPLFVWDRTHMLGPFHCWQGDGRGRSCCCRHPPHRPSISVASRMQTSAVCPGRPASASGCPLFFFSGPHHPSSPLPRVCGAATGRAREQEREKENRGEGEKRRRLQVSQLHQGNTVTLRVPGTKQ